MREQVLRCGRNIFQKKTRSSSTIKFTERNNLRQPASPSKKNIKKSPDLVTNQAIVHGEPAHHIFFKYQVRIVWNMIISLNTIEGVQVERIALGPRRTRGFCQRFFTIKGRPRGQIAALVGSLSLSLSLSLSSGIRLSTDDSAVAELRVRATFACAATATLERRIR